MRKASCSFLLGLFYFFFWVNSQISFAQKTWTGAGGDGKWTTAANWSEGTIPTSTDDVVLDNTNVSGSYTVTLDAGSVQTVRSLQIGYSGNANTITLKVSGVKTSVLTLNSGGSTALHITDGGVLSNQSSSATRGVLLSKSSDVFKMSGNGRYIHATTSTSSAIPEMTTGTSSSNYNFASSSTFELQTASFNSIPIYGNYCYNINDTKSAGGDYIIDGNLSVQQGIFGVCAGSSNTFSIGGNISISNGATFRGSSGSGTATINILGNVTGEGIFRASEVSGTITNIIIGGSITSQIAFNNQTNSLTFSGGSSSVNFSPANSTEPTIKNVTIANGKIVSLGANISLASGTTFTISNGGQLNCGNNVISGSGTFNLETGGTLGIGSSDGITLTSSKGNIQTSTRNFASDGNYVYNGFSAQVTGNGITSVNNLTIDNSSGVSLSGDLSVNNLLTLSSGNLILGTKNLTLGTSASISGTPSASNMVVTDGSGELRKNFSGISTFIFPIGENTGTTEYSPVTLNFTSGTFSNAYAGARCVNSKHSNNSSLTDYINRYWKLTQSGISSFSCDVSFQYNHADVVGNEANLYCGHWDGSNWTILNSVDPTNNILSGTVTSFSDFSGGNSSALPVELVSLNAKVTNENILLTWQTATEINSYGFNVERKLQTAELSNETSWMKIGFVSGCGNSSSPKNYSFVDNNITSGKYSYRLKQIDNNGKFKFSKEIEVEIIKPMNFSLLQNYPNPFNPSTTISFSIPKRSFVTLKIYDQLGNEITTLVNGEKEAGNYSAQFSSNIKLLSSGIYFYRLQAGDFAAIKKLILLK